MAPLKKNLAVIQKFEAFYTGGNIQISKDGQFMFCGCSQQVKVLELETAKTTCTIGQEDEELTSFCVSPDDQFLVLATQNLLLRKWKWKNKELVHTWKALHATPVMSMGFDPTSTLLATGGSDCLIKVWDCIQQYCTHHLRGHTGVVRLVRFHPDIERLQLVSAADDDTVRVWDLKTSTCLVVSRDHYSLVKDLFFTNNGQTMYSCGGDKVVCVWDMNKLKVIRTLPVFESSEGVMVLENLPVLEDGDARDYFVCVGSDGALRVVSSKTGKCAHTDRTLCEEGDGEDDDSKHAIVQAFFCQALDKIVIVMYDHNILFLNNDFTLHKQLSGYLEEVLDIGLVGKDGSHLVVISNSSKVKVFNRHTMECQILSGHTDTVLALAVCPKQKFFATASKDNRVRIWRMNPETCQVSCVAVGDGHAKAVTSVAFSRLSAKFIVSGSEDQTVKLWKLPSEVKQETDQLVTLHSSVTEWAHQAEINCVTVAPNDMYLASASRDKTAKLWSLPDLKLQGVVRGHKRGVWCVQFSTVDKCFATSSADGKINVWNMTDFSLMQSLEGHNSSVLKVVYISGGRQLLSSDSEGLLKIWTLKTNTCDKTLEGHDNKAWALAVHPSEDLVISGGADATVILWKDTTDEEAQLVRAKLEKQILQEQRLENYIQDKKYLKAIGLAITLDQPYRVLNILKSIMKTPTGSEDLRQTLCNLKTHQLGSLLRYASQWNMNTHHCQCAQMVLNIVLKGFPADELLALPDFKTSFEGLLPYTERHFHRADHHQLQATFADYTLQCMNKRI
ncbi:transducin beta-like protein 3 [Babylonia areolata]|uniref:transducin beta-like protein 3 n=1 Tax=Babylonia areolata TaxID=304850 RepID=UPI003FD516A3